MPQTTGQFAKKAEKKRKNPFSYKPDKDFSETTSSPFTQVLHLQRTVGNRAVTRLIPLIHELTYGKQKVQNTGLRIFRSPQKEKEDKIGSPAWRKGKMTIVESDRKETLRCLDGSITDFKKYIKNDWRNKTEEEIGELNFKKSKFITKTFKNPAKILETMQESRNKLSKASFYLHTTPSYTKPENPAKGIPFINYIWLYPNYFKYIGEIRVRILAHESVHLSGSIGHGGWFSIGPNPVLIGEYVFRWMVKYFDEQR